MPQKLPQLQSPSVISPLPTQDMSTVELANFFSKALNEFGKETYKVWHDQTVKQAKEASSQAALQAHFSGIDPLFQSSEGLYGRAYNASLLQGLKSKYEFESAQALNAIKNENKENPQEYLKQSSEFRDTFINDLLTNKHTSKFAPYFDAKIKLEQQSSFYEIDKKAQANEIDALKTQAKEHGEFLKNLAYQSAKYIFSEDIDLQKNTLAAFEANRKLYEQELMRTFSDESTLYSPSEVTKLLSDYQKTFFIRAAQDYISQSDLTREQIREIKNGALKIPNTDNYILDVNRVNSEDYKKHIVKFMFQKLKDKQAADNKARSLADQKNKLAQEKNAIDLFRKLYTGTEPIDGTTILGMINREEITQTVGEKALKMIYDPAFRTSSEIRTVAELERRIIGGENLTKELPLRSEDLKPEDFLRLVEKNAKMQAGEISEIERTNKKFIYDNLVDTSLFGKITNKNGLILAKEVEASYDQIVKDYTMQGVKPSDVHKLAYEKIKSYVNFLKIRENNKNLDHFAMYTVLDNNTNTIDYEKTFYETKSAYYKGRLSKVEYSIQLSYLISQLPSSITANEMTALQEPLFRKDAEYLEKFEVPPFELPAFNY